MTYSTSIGTFVKCLGNHLGRFARPISHSLTTSVNYEVNADRGGAWSYALNGGNLCSFPGCVAAWVRVGLICKWSDGLSPETMGGCRNAPEVISPILHIALGK